MTIHDDEDPDDYDDYDDDYDDDDSYANGHGNHHLLLAPEPFPPKPRSFLEDKPDWQHLRIPLLLIALFALASLAAWKDHASLWVSYESVFADHEFWRVVTALAMHADLYHLLANTPMFLFFGFYLGAYFGKGVFPVLAVVVGALANLATIGTYAPQTRLMGASGMVYGMQGMWLVLYLHYDVRYRFPVRLMRVLGVMLILMVPTAYEDNVSYAAHGFGFLFGGFFAWLHVHSPFKPKL